MKIFKPDKDSFELLIKEKPKKIIICSPWISTEGVKMLTETILSRDLSEMECLEIWFRVTTDDFIFNRTDYQGLLDFCQQIVKSCGLSILSLRQDEKLHAKFYQCDNYYYIGSANLTLNGFGKNIEIMLEDNVNHHEILIGIMNLREKLSSVSLLQIKNFIKMCQQEDIIKLKNEAKKLNENVRNIKIPPTSHKIPPHFRIPW